MTRRLLLKLGAYAACGLKTVRSAPNAPELWVIAHPGVPLREVDGAKLDAIFRGTLKRWSTGKGIIPINVSALSPARVQFDQVVLRMDPNQMSHYWIDQRVRGIGTPPRSLGDPELMVRVVAGLEGAIGYVLGGTRIGSARLVARVTGSEVIAV